MIKRSTKNTLLRNLKLDNTTHQVPARTQMSNSQYSEQYHAPRPSFKGLEKHKLVLL